MVKHLVRVAFTKLIVRDLAAQAAYYRAVCGFGEGHLVRSEIGGRGMEEILFRNDDGGTDLILLRWLDGPAPTPSGVIPGFYTDDLDAFERRVLENGGAVVAAPKVLANGNIQIAFYSDPEGYVTEVLQVLS
jgi:lactoylglutathione lyase